MSTVSSGSSALGNLIAWNQPSSASSTAQVATTTPASTTHTSLGDLVAWNQPSSSTASTTTVQDAQQTVADTSSSLLSSFVPANTSLYGAAPAVDSLLGNIGTSASLNAVAQVNAARSASTQINVFPTTDDAVGYATDSETASQDALVQSALSSVGDANSAILAAYYPNSATSSANRPTINVTS